MGGASTKVDTPRGLQTAEGHATMNEEQERALAYLQSLGADRVRLYLISGQLPQGYLVAATTWLAQLDADERARNERLQAEQAKIATSADKAAWIAAKAAIAAVVLTIVGLVVGIVAWRFPLH